MINFDYVIHPSSLYIFIIIRIISAQRFRPKRISNNYQPLRLTKFELIKLLKVPNLLNIFKLIFPSKLHD